MLSSIIYLLKYFHLLQNSCYYRGNMFAAFFVGFCVVVLCCCCCFVGGGGGGCGFCCFCCWYNKGRGICYLVCEMVDIKIFFAANRKEYPLVERSEALWKSVRSCWIGSSDRSLKVDLLSYFSFLSVLYDWSNKSRGVLSCLWDESYKRTLAGKSSPWNGDSELPLSLSERSFMLCYNCKFLCVGCVVK